MVNEDDFISQTIRKVDAYLVGEREAERLALQEAEQMTMFEWEDKLCWRCGEAESDHYGFASYCDPQEWDGKEWTRPNEQRVFASDPIPREWSEQERQEYNDLLDADWEQYWDAHCPKHGTEYLLSYEMGGTYSRCPDCDAEDADERVQDR